MEVVGAVRGTAEHECVRREGKRDALSHSGTHQRAKLQPGIASSDPMLYLYEP